MSGVKELETSKPEARIRKPIRGWLTLLVHVSAYEEARPRLETAVKLAARCDARLIGVGAEQFELGIFAKPLSDELEFAPALAEHIEQNLAAAHALFERRAGDVQHEWLQVREHPARILAATSRAADLIVAGGARGGDDNSHRVADVAELILTSGRPVLVAPPEGGALGGSAVLVAWKETREARRAVADALPVLKAARRVVVLEVASPHDALIHAQLHTYEVATWLASHGVRAEPRAIAAPAHRIAPTLQGHADDIGADLIVAGCYGRSRVKEWLFGGVTRDLLGGPERFVLMSH